MMYLYKVLTGIGRLDAERAEEILSDADVSFNNFAEYLAQHLEELESKPEFIDVVAISYEFILDTAKAPKLKDYLFKNYLDTRFNISSKDAKKILQRVPKSKRNEVWQWMYEKAGTFYN